MKELATLKDLMIYELQSLHEAENLWSEALKEHAASIANKELKKIFEKGSKTAAAHTEKVDRVLADLRTSSLAKRNIVAADLSRELKEIRESSADPEVLDAGLIVTHQCMNHYMIAKYGSVASFARLLNEETVAKSLHKILEEEKQEDEELSQLAEATINVKAKSALIQ